jgi:hypothetical protein
MLKMVGFTSPMLPRKAEEKVEIKLIRAKLENESLVQIESLYKCEGNTTKGQHFGSLNCI